MGYLVYHFSLLTSSEAEREGRSTRGKTISGKLRLDNIMVKFKSLYIYRYDKISG